MEPRTQDELLLPFEDAAGSRRGFLQLVGFGLTSAAFSGCSRGPLVPAIPALEASPELVPGRAYWIASTCGGCEAGCGVLAKCRDGRPIKLEGTPAHPVSGGGLCPAGQGSVLSLYDGQRFEGPRQGNAASTWPELDGAVRAALETARTNGGRVRLLTGSITSPSTRAWIERFLGEFQDGRHVIYDGLSASAILDAHERTHGTRSLPRHRLDRARVLVAFDADFLATWISPVAFTREYTSARDPEGGRMSRHVHFEARTSLTGCRADERYRLAPWEEAAAVAGLCDLLEVRAGVPRRLEGAIDRAPRSAELRGLAQELWSARGESLVLAGADDLELQLLVNYANHLLGNYGETLDLAAASLQRQGSERELAQLRRDLEAGAVDVLIVQGVNPAYDLGGALPVERAKLLVSLAGAPDETSALAAWVAPEPHFLESWNDAEPYRGTLVLSQPTVPPIRSGRSLRHSLARWVSQPDTASDDRELLRSHWREAVRGGADFDEFFDRALHDGYVEWAVDATLPPVSVQDLRAPAPAAAPRSGTLGLVLYAKSGMLDGRHAHNPWLHELPDPVTKITWDNYACLSPATAARLGLEEGRVVRVSSAGDGASVEVPVHVQPGQHDDVLALAIGYGRAGTDRFSRVAPGWLEGRPTVREGEVIGVSAGAFVSLGESGRELAGREVRVEDTGRSVALASTQDHHSLDVPADLAIHGHETRDMVQSVGFAAFQADPLSAVHGHHLPEGDLWTEDHEGERSWGLAIDLTRCTGCSACVIGCQAENNVPVVGRDEVLRHREMSWLRIDRYFQGEGDALRTHHQPMMCQQCDHAPCESVCPVLATVHSSEGLNQQVYNRCVGTRYCANTCPYKVRRFNWFDYPREDELENHSLNPDVTVRTRGVMEKCSFCVQRIQEAKSEARREGRELADGDVTPACQQSCPANAIVFGDRHDPESRVSSWGARPRAYGVLEELNVRPSVKYLAHVHNGPDDGPSHGDGHAAEDGHAS